MKPLASSKDFKFDFSGFDKFQNCVYIVKYGTSLNLARKVLLELIQVPDDEETILQYYNSYIDKDQDRGDSDNDEEKLVNERRAVIQSLCEDFKSTHRDMAMKRIH